MYLGHDQRGSPLLLLSKWWRVLLLLPSTVVASVFLLSFRNNYNVEDEEDEEVTAHQDENREYDMQPLFESRRLLNSHNKFHFVPRITLPAEIPLDLLAG